MSLADSFTRELYFSNDINIMYVGFEATETFRSFPYDESRSLTTWRGKCLRDVPISDQNLPNLEQRVGYSPLCRGWYEKAKRANGTIVYNGVDKAATNGMLYLAVSVAVIDVNGKMFGVAAIDTSIDELSNILAEKILDSGYLYLADNVMSLVVHPSSDNEVNTILSAEFDCGGDEKSQEKEQFQQKQDSSIKTDKSGIVEHKKCGKDYLLVWNRVENTEYIFFLTVPLEDISATADAAVDTVLKAIGVVIGLCVGLAYPAVFGFLFFVAQSMSKLLKKLVKVINQIAIAPEANITIPTAGCLDVAELVSIVENVNKLLAALRFGNVAWNKGDFDLEISNCRYLEVVMREINNLSGSGVVLNNKGNALRQLARTSKDREIILLEQAYSCYTEAIEIAKKAGGEEMKQASRSLGAGLIQMDKMLSQKNLDSFEEAINMFRNAHQLYLDCQSWKGLAKIGFLIVTHEASSRFLNQFSGLVQEICGDCIKMLRSYLQFSKEFKQQDFNSICHFCYAAQQVGRMQDPCLLLWPLSFLPKISKQLIHTLVAEVLANQHCAMGNPRTGQQNTSPSAPPACSNEPTRELFEGREYKAINMHMSRAFGDDQAVADQRQTALKDVFFVLDASGSMAGSRLQICKNSIKSILNNHIDDNDHVGFMAFASVTKLLFDLTRKEGNLSMMIREVDDLETFGATLFYDAILEAANKLISVGTEDRSASKWIMALTDGEDNCSTIDRNGEKAIRLLKENGISIAIITVGKLPQKTINIVNSYVKAAARGMHVEANDTAKISTAFERVASLIQGVSENL